MVSLRQKGSPGARVAARRRGSRRPDLRDRGHHPTLQPALPRLPLSLAAWRPALAGRSVGADMPVDLFRNLCDELQELGTGSLILLGEGEPLLHPSLFDMIAIARKAGLYVTLFTNGTLLDREKIRSLIDSGLENLQVSLWASSREEYEVNYPGTDPKRFEDVVAGLRLFGSLKKAARKQAPLVTLHATVNRYNFRRIDALADLALETECDAVSFWPFRTVRGRFDCFALSPDDERELVRSTVNLRARLRGFRFSTTSASFCCPIASAETPGGSSLAIHRLGSFPGQGRRHGAPVCRL